MKKLAKSPLRYPGGKSRALKQIIPLIPPKIKDYREPFVGGASVFFAIRSIFQNHIDAYWINDLNYDLYCFWKQTRDSVTKLVNAISDTKANYSNGRVLFDEYTHAKDLLSKKNNYYQNLIEQFGSLF